ncbi:uncharacterized protein [Lolium perenne]|uniref:uncharacterized protein n=1 Tax=Lolium perenne TaxID=4522 RepID=UPI0021EA2C66|nr:uncharacterized protein LOC127301323 [Lolium perenne]
METNPPQLFLPATAAATSARRRSVRSRGARKRRRIAAEDTGGWASLPDDIVRLVADRVLIAGDVVDYVSLRAAGSDWRASTDSPLLAGHRHHPARGWAALCDGDAARPDDADQVAFFKPATGRRVRVRRLRLRGSRIVAFSAGLLVLLHKRHTTVQVLHPFTRAVLLDLPSLATAFRLVGGTRDSLLRMNAAVFTTPTSTTTATTSTIDAVVAWFPGTRAVLYAKPDDTAWNWEWDAAVLDIHLHSVLAFRGGLYATTKTSTNILQLYPPTSNNTTFPVDTPIPDALGDPSSCLYFLVECQGRMLLAVRHYAATPTVHTAVKVFQVDLDRRRLKLVRGIADRALVLGADRCLSVSAKDLPSISGNSVYCSSQYGVECFSIGGGPAGHEWFAALRSVRPFTILDHLVTYCNHLEWARGLMFHEYQLIPDCLVELKTKIKKQDSQLHIPIREPDKKTTKPSPAAN